MNARRIFVTGYFDEQDWKRFVEVLRKIEQRHPEMPYNAFFEDGGMSHERAVEVLRKNWPMPSSGKEPVFLTIPKD